MTSLLSLINLVVDRWRAEGTKLLPPIGKTSVISTLHKTQRKVSTDVIDIYCTTGGMAEDEMDNRCLYLWPLSVVIPENMQYERSEILFADFLIQSHFY